MDALSQVGTISVVITPILSMLKERRPKGRKRELKEFGMISEETVKGDVRSHTIGYVHIQDFIQRNAKET